MANYGPNPSSDAVLSAMLPKSHPLKERRITRAARDVFLKREMQRLRDEVDDILFRVDKFLKLLNDSR